MKFSPKGLLIAAVALLSIIFAFSFVFGTASGDIELKERIFFKWKNSLDVTVAGKDEGKVAESAIQLSRTFTWTDESGKTAATASVAIISIGTDIYVYDGAGNRIGSIEERIFFKWKNSLDVTVANKDEGKVAESAIQMSRTFTWTDESGKTVATASVAIISIGTDIYVYDGAGNRVGSIEERLFSRWGRTWSSYDIKDAGGNKIASSDKTEFMGTTITLTAPDGTKLAKLDRPWVNVMGDSWGIKVLKPGAVDNRILVMIAAFKTAADRDKESGSSKDTSKKK